MQQSTAFNILKMGKNVFLTGSAGSGKTYLLNQYIHYLRARKIPVAVTASTGIAATHMNGVTIHSWSGIGIKNELTDKDLNNLTRKNALVERLQDTQVLIIDEISMLHGKQLNLVNQVLQHIRKNSLPFGGIQLVLAGDFFQLPPVGEKGETNRDKFAFMSQAWLDAQFQICYLTEQYRQQQNADNQNISLDDILNQVRQGAITFEARDALLATFHNEINANRTRLYTHNINVNCINEQELLQLNTEEMTFIANGYGDDKLIETLKKTVRTQEELILKVGAKVMFIKNNNELGVSNGTMGEIIGFVTVNLDNKNEHQSNDDIDKNNDTDDNQNTEKNSNKIENNDIKNEEKYSQEPDNQKPDNKKADNSYHKLPIVRLNNGRQVVAELEEWVIEDENGELLASYSQIPLSLAWAITIHKSQGMTLDSAEIDLSKTFELGQGYVALSRLKSLDGLKLLGMNEISLSLDPLARGVDIRFKELSNEAESSIKNMEEKVLKELQQDFIKKSGGIINQQAIEAYESMLKERQKRQREELITKNKKANQSHDKSISTLEETKILLEQGLGILEISVTRGLAQSTIINHIGELKRLDDTLNLEHIRPSEDVLTKVAKSYVEIKTRKNPDDFLDDGQIKLRAIFEHLNKEINYNTIRLSLVFLT